MRFMKKFSAALVAAAMILGLLAVNVSAGGIEETAKSTVSGQKKSAVLSPIESADYKFVLSEAGTISIDFTFEFGKAYIHFYDSNGNKYRTDNISMTTGTQSYDSYNICNIIEWNNMFEKSVGTAVYSDMPKGTYYIRIFRPEWYGNDKNPGNGNYSIIPTYPSETNNSESGKISCLTLTMSVGDTLKLGTIIKPEEAEVVWKSSKKSVAEVSESGRVKAKKVGRTVITAQSGNSKAKIMIIVED